MLRIYWCIPTVNGEFAVTIYVHFFLGYLVYLLYRLGRVQPKNVSEILNTILERPVRPMHAEEMPIYPSHWRGRMGLSKDEQIKLFSRISDKG